ncbi:MAG: Na(+)/H(+) antiporter NhaD [Haliscomenobacter sp.]|jgi:Na+/H+ antiporter NhaD/arsenite permease-like protein|nr:Na(+)/H(+) antiporter NhaD [Haliscomenobacter sp.]
MITAIVICFIIGYLMIALEHPLKLDKSVPALLIAALIWALISTGHLTILDHNHEPGSLENILLHHMGKTAEILVFLLGAMTIVELVDLHRGFAIITDRIQTKNKLKLLWIISILAFFLSSVLDNLTTTIVMISLVRKLIKDREDRLFYAAMIVIAANAGGAWSPIGDVTTTMLWIGKKVSTLGLMEHLIIPSLLCIIVPLLISGFLPNFKGNIIEVPSESENEKQEKRYLSSKTMLIAGLSGLIFVPIFKSITHLPPYMGMMLSLGVIWAISEYIHPGEEFGEDDKHMFSVRRAMSRIEMSSIIFFLGILMAVAGLESIAVTSNLNGEKVGLLMNLAENLGHAIPNMDIVIILIGVLSAVIDNVPLVAATMGMYPMDQFPIDSKLWQFIAYSAGTGGSMLIIGSAAGVAAMGMERIDFIWYLRKISWIAFLGFIAGAISFIVLYPYLPSVGGGH